MTDAEIRLKRLKIRSWRRGTKEMDLLFGQYADAYLDQMTNTELDEFEALLAEEDPIISTWITGVEAPPARHSELVEKLTKHVISLQI